jgi:hypothetical protein
MDQITSIDVAHIIAPILASRDVIRVLRSEIEKNDALFVQLNLEHVEFISRSAAHELLRLKEWFANQNSKRTIELTNTNEEVTKMLRVVASNRAVPKTKEKSVEIESISIDELQTPFAPLRFLKRLFAN